jgi:hypothetical protein
MSPSREVALTGQEATATRPVAVRFLVAIATAVVLVASVAAPHHHSAPGGVHECVACTVGGALEARDATPAIAPPPPVRVASAASPAAATTAGFPLGAVPGQSPPLR